MKAFVVLMLYLGCGIPMVVLKSNEQKEVRVAKEKAKKYFPSTPPRDPGHDCERCMDSYACIIHPRVCFCRHFGL